ncbi:lysyl-tRNA synthetase, partial [sediment metagenome]
VCGYIKDDENKRDESKNITLKGRIKLLRIMGKAAFAKLEDSSGLVQVYYSRDELPEGYYNKIKNLLKLVILLKQQDFHLSLKRVN